MALPNNNFKKEGRPWGERLEFARNEQCTVVVISVKNGEALSLQTHKGRDETWFVLDGAGKVTVGENVFEANTGDCFHIEKGEKHRIEAGLDQNIIILEVSRGDYEDDDIVRLADKYGRESV